MPRQLTLIWIVMLVVWTTGCEINASNTKIQYMPDMADNPSVKTQESYLDPPEGAVAINAILFPETIEETEKVLKNPYPANEQIVAEGKELFNIYCIVCHGPNGDGENKLGDVYPRPPDITMDVYAERADGFFFHRITFGSAIMPAYGHALSIPERWKVVHYVRELQKKDKG